MTMTEPKQTEGQRIVAEWHCPSCHDNDDLIDMIDASISAERLKAQGLVEALEEIKGCDHTGASLTAEYTLAEYYNASAADDKGNGG